MAKAKKQESGAKKATPAKSKSAPKAKGADKKSAPAGGSSAPMIDTSLAAEAAARMLLNRSASGPVGAAASGAAAQPQADAPEQAQDKRETSTFKQLKQGLSKPASQNLGGILGGVQGGKKSNQPFGGPNQQFRNQTFGADVNRSGVPRRTGG